MCNGGVSTWLTHKEFHVFHNKSSVDLYPVQLGRERVVSRSRHLGPTTVNGYLFLSLHTRGNGTSAQTKENQLEVLDKVS